MRYAPSERLRIRNVVTEWRHPDLAGIYYVDNEREIRCGSTVIVLSGERDTQRSGNCFKYQCLHEESNEVIWVDEDMLVRIL